ncbi:C3a anaphylatoxin chemotactic receptor-like [Pyxicephalus adspersus]|uniref:C3a anaphylatoxin chemotactic receptor-like n=1 Tax=Pyxicephalus adspersus TaxID=30357 RepID=UPI003B59D2F1
MNTSDQIEYYSDSSYYHYRSTCKDKNFTLDLKDVMKILDLPSFQLAFTISKVLIITCFCVAFIVGILGNGLVIWIAGFKLKTVSAVWFVNLAIVDFLFCISLPFRISVWLMSDDGRLYLLIPNFAALYINSVISVLFLTVISIDRCVSIMWPLWAKVHRTQKLAKICSVFIWIVPTFVTITCMLSLQIDVHLFYAIVPLYSQLLFFCQMENSPVDKYLKLIRSVIIFGISFLIILICYGLIIFRLCSNPIKRPRRYQRTFRIIIAVVACFFGCWFPYNVWPFVAKDENLHQVLIDFIISSLCLCLVSISSCLNPILYVLLGKGRGSSWRKMISSRMENTINELK